MRAIRLEVVEPKIAEHRGRIVKTAGDGLLIEFFSVFDALRCAVEMQKAMRDNNAGIRSSERIEFRIGIHQGDIEMGLYEDAIPKFLLELQEQHDFPPAYRCLAACFAHLGKLQEAHDIYDRLRSINPSAVDPSRINPPASRNPRFRKLLLSGLRLASGKPR